MSKSKTKDEILNHKKKSIDTLDNYLTGLIDSGDVGKESKADKLSYWLTDWTRFLDFEERFSPMSLRRYKRGEIIKVHLGFNIGSEEGGLHYAVVVDKKNAKSSPVVTIVPLTSVKPSTDLGKLKNGTLFLGNELFTNLSAKVSSTNKHLTDELALLQKLVDEMNLSTSKEDFDAIKQKIATAKAELELLNRMRKEVLSMKIGSIALVNQITTVSKIRIYDPKTDHDILSNIKLSNEKLDLIDKEICKLYTNV